MKVAVLLFILILISSCGETIKEPTKDSTQDMQIYVRQGYRFYKIEFNSEGSAQVSKGTATEYTQPFEEVNVEATKEFKVASIENFIKELERLIKKPITTAKRLDAPRVEIFYRGKKVYDGYYWDSGFWNIVKPIMGGIPEGFNPFTMQEDW